MACPERMNAILLCIKFLSVRAHVVGGGRREGRGGQASSAWGFGCVGLPVANHDTFRVTRRTTRVLSRHAWVRVWVQMLGVGVGVRVCDREMDGFG